MENQIVMKLDEDNLYFVDLTGEMVTISLMTPDEVEEMYRQDPSLVSLFES